MTKRALKIMNMLMVVFLILPVSNIQAVSDTKPPVLESVVLSKTEMNAGESNTIYIKPIDDLSGVKYVSFHAVSPSGKQVYGANIWDIDSQGRWYGNIPIGAYSEAGIWKISYISLTDNAGNTSNYDYGNDYEAEFLVVNQNPDIKPPILDSVVLSKAEMNAGESNTIYIKPIDDLSGVKYVSFHADSPSGKQVYGANIWDIDSQGRWYGNIPIGPNSEAGIWKITYISLTDNAGNTSNYNYGHDYEAEFLVVNQDPDTKPPVLDNVVLSKAEVNVGESNTIFIKPIDDLSGVKYVSFHADSPSGEQSYGANIWDIDSQGRWYGNIPIGLNSETGIWKITYISLTDNAGNTSYFYYGYDYEAEFEVIEVVPFPKVNDVTDQDFQVSGQATPGTKVTVKAGTNTLGQGTAASNGTFSVNIPNQKAGTQLTILFTYNAGNTVEIKKEVKDVSAPFTPIVNEVTDKSTVVSGKAEPESTVIIKRGTIILSQGTVNVDGTFSITIPVQKAGTELTVTSMDHAENISQATIVIVKDVTAPVAPEVNVVTDKTKVVSGTAEPESTVIIKRGTTILSQGTVNVDGTFSITIPVQKAGTELTVTSMDHAENISQATIIIVKDVTAPVAPEVNVVTDKTKVVSGKAEPGSRVVIKQGTTILGQGIVTVEGTFSIGIPLQKAGTVITVTSTDQAGNISVGTSVKVAQAITFIDLQNVLWAKEAIETMASLGIINGVGDNKFNPDSNVTRAQFAKLIIKTLGITGTANNPFMDVNSSDWFMNDVALAYKYGIVTGVSATEFSPNRPITRQELAVMMVRAMNYKQKVAVKDVNGTLSKFTDRNQIDNWAKEAVAISIEQGLMNGITATTFSPKTNATRAQAAVIMYRFYLQFIE